MKTNKTVKQLNKEAGDEMASTWLRACERMLADSKSPMPLTAYDKSTARINLISEYFYADAAKANARWWVSDRNWPVIAAAAECYAKQVLRYIGAERYPLTLAHFTKKD